MPWTHEGEGRPTPRHGRFTTNKEPRYALYRELCSPQGRPGRVWRKENPLFPQGLENQIIQPVASRYTDYVIPAQYKVNTRESLNKKIGLYL